MNPETWQKVSPILDRLLDLTEPQQADFLQQLRRDDPQLCAEVESLLGQGTSNLLETPPTHLLDALQPTYVPASSSNPIEADTDPLRTDRPSHYPPQAGRYLIQEEIARGGMGAILRAYDPEIRRVLAVKVLLPAARVHPEAEARFLREAQITGRLQHPGIPPIHELGRLDDGTPFFAMKLIEGQTLTALINASGFAKGDSRFVGIFEQICRTLAYAHSQGIIHRDLKPSNVMVGAFGEVQVMDWGLAKSLKNGAAGESAKDNPDVADVEGFLSVAGSISGTPAYMAPEQARGDSAQLDERCDVFGLGEILCAILTAKPPFTGSPADMIRKSAGGDLEGAFVALRYCGADAELVEIAQKCLAPKPKDRYRNAGEVADAVTRYREGVQEKLKKAELEWEKAQVQVVEERRRRRLTLTLAAAILIMILGGTGAGLWYQHFTTQRQTRAQNLNDLVTRSLDDATAEHQQLVDRLTDPGKVHVLLGDMQVWRDSLKTVRSHVRQGRKLADSDPDVLDPVLHDRLEKFEANLTTAEKGEAFASELDGIRIKAFEPPGQLANASVRAGKPFMVLRAEEYAAIFRRNGWDIAAGDRDALLASLRMSTIRFVAANGLEDWAQTALKNEPQDQALVKRLLQLARGIDPDPWRDQFRQWDVWADAAKLQKVTRDLKPGQQPPQVLSTLAELQRVQKQDPMPLLRSAILHYPSDFWLCFQFGCLASERKLYDESAAAYRAALALRPRSYHTLNNFGIAMSNKGDLDIAIDLFAKALEYHPNFARAHSSMGYVLQKRGKIVEAAHHLRAALAADPDDAEIRSNLGAALAIQGDMEEALVHFDSALKISPDHHSAHSNRAIALRVLGRLEEAIQAMKRAHELHPRPAREVSIEEYERALRLQKTETQTPVEMSILEKGFAGKLAAELPFDLAPTTAKSYRASHVAALKAGRYYQVDLTGDFDTYLRVEDNHYNSVVFNDDVRYPENLNSRLVFTPQKDGLYRLIVTTYRMKTTGTYELRLKEVTPLGPPTVVRGTLDAEEKYKWHAVPLRADSPCTLTLQSNDFSTRIRLHESTEKKVLAASDAMSPDNSHLSRIDVTPKITGNYQVYVSSSRPNQIGEYTLIVQQFAAASQQSKK